MKTSENGRKFIANFEGLRLTAYKCPSGIWTIGYGHTGNVKEGMTITKEQADQFFANDLKRFEDFVNVNVKVGLNQNQFDALVSFAYNCGTGALQKSTLLRKLNVGDYKGASDEFLKWTKGANGVPLQGLVKRRQQEREMFLAQAVINTNSNDLPYSVMATTNLNIRKEPNGQVIGSYRKGQTFKVWAIQTVGTDKWGKNEKGFFALKYTQRI